MGKPASKEASASKSTSASKSASASNGAVGKTIILALATALFLKLFILDFMVVDGYSMDPAIKPGTVVLVCRIFYGIKLPFSKNYLISWGRGPGEGDIVVFYTPMGEIAVKRLNEAFTDSFFALGDNIIESYDSRDYGPVPYENIIGKVLGIR